MGQKSVWVRRIVRIEPRSSRP